MVKVFRRESNMGKNKHIVWIDSLKGLVSIFVVLGHVFLGFTNNNLYPNEQIMYLEIKNWIYTWHMPIFMFISGLCFSIAYVKQKLEKEKIKKQILNLLLLYLIFQFTLCSLKLVFTKFTDEKMSSFFELIYHLIIPNNIMWYIWVLIIYYIISIILLRNSNNKSNIKYLIIFAIFGILTQNNGLRLGLKNLLYYYQFFYLGIFLKDKIEKIDAKFIIVSFIWGLAYVMEFTKLEKKYWVIKNINAYLIIFFLIGLFNKIRLLNKNKFFIKCGENSLQIYLLHTYFVTIMKAIFLRINFSYANISVFVTTLIPILICLMIGELSKKIKILNYIFRPINFIETFNRRKNNEKV